MIIQPTAWMQELPKEEGVDRAVRTTTVKEVAKDWGNPIPLYTADDLQDAVLAEREKVAAWMRSKSYATGHGDTTEDLLKELEWQVAEREREACARIADKCIEDSQKVTPESEQQENYMVAMRILSEEFAIAIRARGEV